MTKWELLPGLLRYVEAALGGGSVVGCGRTVMFQWAALV